MVGNTDFLKINEVHDDAVWRGETRVVAQHALSSTGYELILERGAFEFAAGRLITLHGRDLTEDSSYTIARGEQDTHVHVLYRLVPTGVLTPQLVQLKSGDMVEWSGPYGQFTLRDPQRPIVFLATGTGIAPCRAFYRTYPDLDLTVIHGVREPEDLFYRAELEACSRYYPCCSRVPGPGFHGRIDAFMADFEIVNDAHYYLCGAYEMIYAMQSWLQSRGIPNTHIFIEGYYYRLEV